MPNVDYQRHTFLGGEVSPSLYERADMDKFSRWFAKAENIRFRETGGFRNRAGFVKVADTKHNASGDSIKLLSFSFNDEESFLVELGSSYARFFKNGQPIMVNNQVYELQTPILGFESADIKYAQAGDTIFIVHPNYGIYELARLQADGTAWEFKKFNTDVLPMDDENTDEDKTFSLAQYAITAKRCTVTNPVSSVYNSVSFTFNNEVVFTGTGLSIANIVAGVEEAIGDDYVVTLNGEYLEISPADIEVQVPDFSLTFSASGAVPHTVSDFQGQNYADSAGTYAIARATNIDEFYTLTSIYVKGQCAGSVRFEGTKDITAASIDASMRLCNGFGAYDGNAYTGVSVGAKAFWNPRQINYYSQAGANGGHNPYAWITITGTKWEDNTYTYNSSAVSNSDLYYTLSSEFPLLADIAVGESVLIKNQIDAQVINGTYTATTTLGPVKSDGNWRAYSLGNWAGKVQIQYSVDDKQTWVDYYSWTSEDSANYPYNTSTSGTVKSDSIVYFRIVLTISSGSIKFFFTPSSFAMNSYYKLLSKSSDNKSAIVKCVKNNVGTFSNNYHWRNQIFSVKNGWPQTVAFYQNRLFFGKGYIIYGSKTDDFWDFYEPINLQSTDPITMSLLSSKVNTIRNLVTQRSFFTFTGGGEFGIGSEGALTQSDKFLKPFSSNGSAPCLPVLISDVVLFVDKSYNSVRALKYALEADGYEAPDITLNLAYLLRNEKFISTDQIFEEKEALFLSDSGTIWVLKYITDQNILSWSHYKHAMGKITNICAVPNGHKHDLYIIVEYNDRKWIEVMREDEYLDTVEYHTSTTESKIAVTGPKEGDKRLMIQDGVITEVTIDEDGKVPAPADTTKPFKIGASYTSTATLLTPVIQESDYSHSTYNKKRPFKVHFYYLDSYGFKIGVVEDEKMSADFNRVNADMDAETDLTSGKESVLIPSRFEHSSMVSFVQDRPYPMEIADVLVETDFGGK